MTIHDELILALTQPNEEGNVPLHDIVRTNDIAFTLEEPIKKSSGVPLRMTPDITVTIRPKAPRDRQLYIAIELENDVQWDFARSLQQVKKYQKQVLVTIN